MTTRLRWDNQLIGIQTAGYSPVYDATQKVGLEVYKNQIGTNNPHFDWNVPSTTENDYSMTFRALQVSPFQKWRKAYGVYYWYSTQGVKTLLSVGFSSNERLALLNRLNGKLEGGDWEPGVSAGEIPEALRLIGDRAKSFAGAFNALRRGRFADAARLVGANKGSFTNSGSRGPSPVKLRDASNAWLEMAYGWKPLCTDIVDASIYIGSRLENTRRRRVGVFDFREKHSVVEPAPYIYPWSPTRKRVELRYYATFDKGDPPQSSILDPLAIAWELIPTSFIVDWFLPVGDWLGAHDIFTSVAAGNIRLHSSTLTKEWHGPVKQGRYASKATDSVILPTYVPRRENHCIYVRDCNLDASGVPLPKFKWLEPFQDDLEKTRNLVALAISNGRRLFG